MAKSSKIRLFDAAFSKVASMSAKGENLDLKPRYFEWYRGDDYHTVCFFTDSCVQQAGAIGAKIKVAWLLEPPPFRTTHYDYVRSHMEEFDYILTYRKDWIELYKKALFYPYGGSMISPSKWGIYPKNKLVSIIVSGKNEATGHRLRHEIVRMFGSRVDVMGSGYGPYVDKFEALKDYQYSIVVQGERPNWCFDEKLVDCFAVGTIPIYWGCSEIDRFFALSGMVTFQSSRGLDYILRHLADRRIDTEAITENLGLARQYLCVEDWIYEKYPFLFEVEYVQKEQ